MVQRGTNAMEYKTPKNYTQNNHIGVTLIELIAAVCIASLLLVTFFVAVNPGEKKAEGRDNRRLADMAMIDSAMGEYFLDNEVRPDLPNTLRVSTTLPDGGISLDNSHGGWVLENLSTYISRLPIDPENNETYFYSYYHTGFGYELNARLEYLSEQALNDVGNDPNVYEIGNNLQLISP